MNRQSSACTIPPGRRCHADPAASAAMQHPQMGLHLQRTRRLAGAPPASTRSCRAKQASKVWVAACRDGWSHMDARGRVLSTGPGSCESSIWCCVGSVPSTGSVKSSCPSSSCCCCCCCCVEGLPACSMAAEIWAASCMAKVVCQAAAVAQQQSSSMVALCIFEWMARCWLWHADTAAWLGKVRCQRAG